MFASKSATECRAKYFLFCKDMGDPAMATICASEPHLFSYHLAPKRYFPIDFRHKHLVWGGGKYFRIAGFSPEGGKKRTEQPSARRGEGQRGELSGGAKHDDLMMRRL
jgi:hypothetical protein